HRGSSGTDAHTGPRHRQGGGAVKRLVRRLIFQLHTKNRKARHTAGLFHSRRGSHIVWPPQVASSATWAATSPTARGIALVKADDVLGLDHTITAARKPGAMLLSAANARRDSRPRRTRSPICPGLRNRLPITPLMLTPPL